MGQLHPNGRKIVLVTSLFLIIWLAVTALLGMRGFFLEFDSIPPKILFGVVPAILTIIGLIAFSPFFKKEYLQAIPPAWLINFHTFRILMEIILWWLWLSGWGPKMMTFEGANADILVGITAPLVYYLWIKRGVLSSKIVIVWNVVSILILANVVVIGLLSAPTQFRVFMTDIPNTFIGYFPYGWLPFFIVPLTFFVQMLSIKQILQKDN